MCYPHPHLPEQLQNEGELLDRDEEESVGSLVRHPRESGEKRREEAWVEGQTKAAGKGVEEITYRRPSRIAYPPVSSSRFKLGGRSNSAI